MKLFIVLALLMMALRQKQVGPYLFSNYLNRSNMVSILQSFYKVITL